MGNWELSRAATRPDPRKIPGKHTPLSGSKSYGSRTPPLFVTLRRILSLHAINMFPSVAYVKRAMFDFPNLFAEVADAGAAPGCRPEDFAPIARHAPSLQVRNAQAVADFRNFPLHCRDPEF